jgi:hypothetical protein
VAWDSFAQSNAFDHAGRIAELYAGRARDVAADKKGNVLEYNYSGEVLILMKVGKEVPNVVEVVGNHVLGFAPNANGVAAALPTRVNPYVYLNSHFDGSRATPRDSSTSLLW